ncbi:MAG: type II toxin-antitoxin system VapC family toxin [Myxococcales bacterium]
MAPEVFLDTAYAVALSSRHDKFHVQAMRLAGDIRTAGVRLVTSRAIVLEIGNALSRQRYRGAAIRLLEGLEDDPAIEIVPVSEQLYQRGWQLYRQRPDKEWGLTDCISFVVMQERGIMEALTSDEHFQQAGYRALMRQSLAG